MRRSVMNNRSEFLASLFSFVLTCSIIVWTNANQNGSRTGKTDKEHSNALAALDFWTQARAYPSNDIPADQYFRAYQMSRAKHQEILRAVNSDAVWVPIGPANDQGRSLSVALN